MGENSMILEDRSVRVRSVLQFRQADFQLDGRDDLHHPGAVTFVFRMPRRPEVNSEAGFVGVDRHLQALGPRPDEYISARADDLFQVRRELVGQAIGHENEESKLEDAISFLTGPVRFPKWNSQLKAVSGIGGEVELVVHLMADRDSRPTDEFDVLNGAGVVGTERPFAILVQSDGDATDAAQPGPAAHALQADGFEFLDRLLLSGHAGLPNARDLMDCSWFQQGRAA